MNLKGTKQKRICWKLLLENQWLETSTYYASKAKKKVMYRLPTFLNKLQTMKREHAKLWFKLLHNGMPDTMENLKDAAAGENYEWTDMYARMAKEAREEGFNEIAAVMEGVLAIEKLMKNVMRHY